MVATRVTPTRRTLATRLIVSHSAVLLVGILSAVAVTAVVGPTIFHRHLLRSGQTSVDLGPVEEAYAEANLLSLAIALLVAVSVSVAVSWYVIRRVRQPLKGLTQASRELKRGHFATRVPLTGAGAELDDLAEAFNSMASRLEQSEVTRRRLLADLAHELRTPIATLMTYHDALSDGVRPTGGDVFEVLSSQTQRLARLATDIEQVSIAEEGQLSLERTPVAVYEFVAASTKSHEEQFTAKDVRLVVNTSETTSGIVDVDPQRIEQVLSNLLSNALRHTSRGGLVTVETVRHSDEVEIAVHDNGEGLAPEQLTHVFERFYRGDTARDRDRSGSGVGLTLSRAIADLHGGSLTAESEGLGRGARFILTLPSPSHPHRRRPPRHPVAAASLKEGAKTDE